MEKSDCLADINKVYMHTKATRKEQPTIRLWYINERFGSLTVWKKEHARIQHGVPTDHLADMEGLNVRRRQPRPWYTGVKDTFISKTRQHMKEKFVVMGDQIEVLTTRLSNMGGHNWDGFGDPSTEHGMHECQHHA